MTFLNLSSLICKLEIVPTFGFAMKIKQVPISKMPSTCLPHSTHPGQPPLKPLKLRGPVGLEIRGSLEMHVHTLNPSERASFSQDGGGHPFPGSSGVSRASVRGQEDVFYNSSKDLAGGVIRNV